jgi:hypothetical protein
MLSDSPAHIRRVACSITALSYLQPSMVRAPTITRRFAGRDGIDLEIMDCNTSKEELQSSEHILNTMCDLCDWLYLAMTGNINNEPNARTRLLREMRHWRSNISSFASAQASGNPEMCCLR